MLIIPANAQLLRSSPQYTGKAGPLTLPVGQFDEYNVTLTANTPIVFSIPTIPPGTQVFRVNTCQNASGGWTPTFTAPVGLSIVNRVGTAVTTTTANACDTEYWTYRALTNQLVLESVSFNTGGSGVVATSNPLTGTGAVGSPITLPTSANVTVTTLNATVNNIQNVQTAGATCVSSASGADSATAFQTAFNAATFGAVVIPPCPSGFGYALKSAITYNTHTLGQINISCPGVGTPLWVNNSTGGWAFTGNLGDAGLPIIIDNGCGFVASQNTGYAIQLNTESFFRINNVQATGGTFTFTRVFDLNAAQQGTISNSYSASNGTALDFRQLSAIDSNQDNVSSFRSFGDTNCVNFEGAANSNKLDTLSCQVSTNGVQTNSSAAPNYVIASEFEQNTQDYTQVTGITYFIGDNFAGSSGALTTTSGQTTVFQGGYTVHPFVNNGQVVIRDMEMNGTFTNNSSLFTTCSGNYGTHPCIDVRGYGGLSTSFSGTGGAATCYPVTAGGHSFQEFACFLNGYANTSTAETYSYATKGIAFPYGESLIVGAANGGTSCGTYNPTTSNSALTLPANAAMTAETCIITVMGMVQ